MKIFVLILSFCPFAVFCPFAAGAQQYNLANLLRSDNLIGSSRFHARPLGDSAVSTLGLLWLKGVTFDQGTLDIDLRGKDAFLKSFLGLAFHGANDSTYEVVFFRPFNFQHADTLRHDWSVQYMALPGFGFDSLRKYFPLRYEHRVNPVPQATDWFHATISVSGDWIRVYVNHSPIPSLEAPRLGNLGRGMVGLWAYTETTGDFANLTIHPYASATASVADSVGPGVPPTYTVVGRNASNGSDGSLHLSDDYGDGIAWINGLSFTNGDLEFDVRGANLEGRSFVGLAFHGSDNHTFEVIYLRPFNFLSPDSAKKTHCVQYVSSPDYSWKFLRDTYPGRYEGRVRPTPDPNDWFHVRVSVHGKRIRVFVNRNPLPSLEVESLVSYTGTRVGYYVGDGSGGDWKGIKVSSAP